VAITKPEFNIETGPDTPVIRAITPIYDAQERLFGLFVITAHYGQLLKSAVARLRTTGTVIVLDNDGTDIHRTPDGEISTSHDNPEHSPEETAVFTAIQNLENKAGTLFLKTRGNDVVLHYTPVDLDHSLKDSGIGIGLAVPREQLFENAQKTANKHLWLSLALVIAASILAYIVSARMTRPLTKAIGAIRSYTADSETLDLPTARRDEVGALSHAFTGLVTRLEQSRDAEQATAHRMQAILDNTAEGMITVDTTGRIQHYNRGAETIFGFPPEEIIGANIDRLMHETEPDPEDERLHRFTENQPSTAAKNTNQHGIAGSAHQMTGIRKDGSHFPVELSVSEILIPDGKIYSRLIRDVSERQQFENQLKRRHTELEQANWETGKALEIAEEAALEAAAATEAKSAFLASMSHEIRTPMNGVLGMATLLLQTELNPNQREQALIIKESGDALLELLNDILDLSKIEAGKTTIEKCHFSVAGLLHTVNSLWQNRATQKGLNLVINNNLGEIDCVESDGTRLRQILHNLIGNAIKFTESGAITLRVSPTPRGDDRIGLLFEIIDSGTGLTAEQISGLFRPFTQADGSTTRKYGGTGLGLTLSKNFAEMLGGKIGVDSTPGEGSRFWFTILADAGDPALMEAEFSSNANRPLVSAPLAQPLRILVAEDNKVNQKIVQMLLEPIDCTVDIVDNGLEALAALEQKSYDLILMDVMMPEMDGPTATQAIRKMDDPVLANLPIIALTANAMKGDRENYLSVGMTDYVAKPIHQDQLIRTILKVMKLPLADDQPPPPAKDQSGESGGPRIAAPDNAPAAQAHKPAAPQPTASESEEKALNDFSTLMDDFDGSSPEAPTSRSAA
jgi:PAS domain S-box-containing protein